VLDTERALLYFLLEEYLKKKRKPPIMLQGGGGTASKPVYHDNILGVTETQHHLHAYGEIYTYDNKVHTHLAAQGTWYQVTVFTDTGTVHEMLPSAPDGWIECVHAGKYLCTCSITCSSLQATDYVFALFNNDVELENMESARTTSVASQLVGGTITGLAELDAGDKVTLWVKRLDGADVDKVVLCSLVNFTLARLL
jgi:hypothetical protein